MLSNDIIIVIIEFTGYGGFAVVNTAIVVVEKKYSCLISNRIRLKFYSSEFIHFLNDDGYKNRIDKYNLQDEKISIRLFYQCCDNYFKAHYIFNTVIIIIVQSMNSFYSDNKDKTPRRTLNFSQLNSKNERDQAYLIF